MDQIQPFDLVVFLALLAMFIVGYAQGIMRRLLGILAMLFSLGIAAQLRAPLGNYLAQQWTLSRPEYSWMVAFGVIFLGAAIALSLGIQFSYRPAPIINRYPVLDEILGGVLGVLESLIILAAILIIIDPYFSSFPTHPGAEFAPLRGLHDFIDNAVSAQVLRDQVIPSVFSWVGFLFPKDVIDTFAAVLIRL
ncbi:MAG TPA: CvpA family protein [Candidatus Limnocylindrales bacterium]|nr:CvpA family protein [Candidatus Limnocylindrales bacterium]